MYDLETQNCFSHTLCKCVRLSEWVYTHTQINLKVFLCVSALCKCKYHNWNWHKVETYVFKILMIFLSTLSHILVRTHSNSFKCLLALVSSYMQTTHTHTRILIHPHTHIFSFAVHIVLLYGFLFVLVARCPNCTSVCQCISISFPYDDACAISSSVLHTRIQKRIVIQLSHTHTHIHLGISASISTFTRVKQFRCHWCHLHLVPHYYYHRHDDHWQSSAGTVGALDKCLFSPPEMFQVYAYYWGCWDVLV